MIRFYNLRHFQTMATKISTIIGLMSDFLSLDTSHGMRRQIDFIECILRVCFITLGDSLENTINRVYKRARITWIIVFRVSLIISFMLSMSLLMNWYFMEIY